MELKVELKIGTTRNLSEIELGKTLETGPPYSTSIKNAFKAYMTGEFAAALERKELLLLFEQEFDKQWEDMIRANFPDAQHEASVPR